MSEDKTKINPEWVKAGEGPHCDIPGEPAKLINIGPPPRTYFFDKTLDEIAIACQTDRASVFTRTYAKPHNYAVHYDKLFTPLRDQPVKLLEVGVGGGEGVRMWMEYFSSGRFYGVDIVSKTNQWNEPGTNGIYTFNQGDQTDPTFWACWLADNVGGIDIVIDDGSHDNSGIITTFKALWPALTSGGFYAIEDLGVAYGVGSIFVKPGYPNHMDWVKQLLDEVNIGTGVDSMYLSKELVILKKA